MLGIIRCEKCKRILGRGEIFEPDPAAGEASVQRLAGKITLYVFNIVVLENGGQQPYLVCDCDENTPLSLSAITEDPLVAAKIAEANEKQARRECGPVETERAFGSIVG